MNKSSKKLVVIKKDIIFAELKENVSTCPMCAINYVALMGICKNQVIIYAGFNSVGG